MITEVFKYSNTETDRIPKIEGVLKERYLGFAENLTFDEFKLLSPEVRRQIILRNPIIQSDTYNRTMEHLRSEEWDKESTYVLQMRKSEFGFLVAAGINDLVNEIADVRITKSQLDFAKEYYSQVEGVKYFNEDKWKYIIEKHNGKLPINIYGVKEGTVLLPGDPALVITGPNEIVAHFEPYFHRIFYPSLVATNAKMISEITGPDRFIEVGLRGSENMDKHLSATKAMYIGGGIRNTSSDMAASYYPQFKLVGTIGHRYIQSFEDEEDAFRNAIEKIPSVTLLVDLYDTYSGIDKALKLKSEYREKDKKIWIRLDSGDLLEETVYALKRQKEMGFMDPAKDKIVIEGLESIDHLNEIEDALNKLDLNAKDFVIYGAGSILVSENTSRCNASTGFKLSKYGEMPTVKFSNSKGKESLPGFPVLGYAQNGERVIAQLGEPLKRNLFVSYYHDKEILQSENIEVSKITAELGFEELKEQIFKKEKTPISPLTQEIIQKIRSKAFVKGGEN